MGATSGEGHPYEMDGSFGKKKKDFSGESQERIVDPEGGFGGKRGDSETSDGYEGGIVVTTNVTFAHEDLNQRER